MKRIYIRTDGNEIIASGHVMRCLSIAEQIRTMGAEVIFVLADERPAELIQNRGFSIKVLDSVWNDLQKETNVLCDYLQKENAEILLIDSYFVTFDYLKQISLYTKIVYIDDLQKFLYPVNTLIHYNVFADEMTYMQSYMDAGMNIDYMVGASYIPLREEFTGKTFDVREEVRKVLITTGGTDRLNVAGNLLEKVLEHPKLHELEFHVIVGCFNQNKELLNQLENKNSNVYLHENVTDMSRWMRECDVAVSAAGTTTYELCACGIPSVCLEIADNQEGAIAWEENDYMTYAGNAYKNMTGCMSKCVEALIAYKNSYDFRTQRSKRMQTLVDGYGAERIARRLICGGDN